MKAARVGLPLLIAAAAILPFLFVAIPPLTDAPGHLAQFAIQAAPADSPLRHFYGFHWALRLNLGTDVLVEALRHAIGLKPAFWLVSAAIPALTALAVLVPAKVSNPLPAAGASWALAFCYSGAFLYGLLNYVLAMALALLAFAGWIALERRRALRESLCWIAIPALMIAHAIGGALLPAMIFARTVAKRDVPLRERLIELRPLLALIPVILIWKLTGSGGGLSIRYDFAGKATAIVTALRDQNRLFDIASAALILLVPIVGRLIGARYARENGAVVLIVALLFLVTPNELNGSSAADMRLIPPLAILMLVLQDWSGVAPRARRIILGAGIALVAVRLAATTESFAGYAQSYRAESAALPHIAPGARVLALVDHPCRASRSWRGHRLDHLPSLATVDRAAWTNLAWDVGDIHLLRIDYRPSPLFYDDPSQYVWPADCLDKTPPADPREARRTIDQAMPLIPLDRVDYLWLVHATLPAGPWASQLQPVWSNGASTLYRSLSAAGGSSRR